MNATEKLVRIIEKGYFPKELIPFFETKGLSSILETYIIPNLNSFRIPISKYCKYSISNINQLRRILGIPNPLNQILLSKVITDNWEEINQHISTSSLSLSKPVFKENLRQALSKEVELSEVSYERTLRSTDSYFLLRADIARFYSTIYTHSIPWALHTKEIAKRERKNNTLLGNKLDTYIRLGQDNQTLGIPVGPDTSLVISEIIGSIIDNKITNKIKGIKNGFRYLDDYYLYFDNLQDAETALSELIVILGEYELELNTSKTEIISLPEPLEPKWVSELRLFEMDTRMNKKHILSYSKAFEFARLFPNERVLLYSLNRMEKVIMDKESWKLYEAMILKIILAEPDAIPTAKQILVNYFKLGYELDFEKLGRTLHEIIHYHCKYNHTKEITWALWLCYIFKIDIEPNVVKDLSQILDSIIALVVLDLRNKGLLKDILDTSIWEKLMNLDNLYSEYWLLAYEASVKGWIRTTDDYIKNDSFFSLLRKQNVQFYNERAGTTIEEIKSAKKTMGIITIPDDFLFEFQPEEEYAGDISGAH